MLYIYVVLIAFLCLKLEASYAFLVQTGLVEVPQIAVVFENMSDSEKIVKLIAEYEGSGVYTRDSLKAFAKKLDEVVPGGDLKADPNELKKMFPKELLYPLYTAGPNAGYKNVNVPSNRRKVVIDIESDKTPCSSGCECSRDEARTLTNIADWKQSVNLVKCKTIPVNVDRNTIVRDAVRAYKAIDPSHIFHRNIKVTFEGEEPLDSSVTRVDFFVTFFREIIQYHGLFQVNSKGFNIIAPGRPNAKDLDFYEAFGFYLAKLYQNNLTIGQRLSLVIFDFIRTGQISKDLQRLQTWEPNVSSYDSAIQLLKPFQVQLMMIALGFSRACPPNLLFNHRTDSFENEFI